MVVGRPLRSVRAIPRKRPLRGNTFPPTVGTFASILSGLTAQFDGSVGSSSSDPNYRYVVAGAVNRGTGDGLTWTNARAWDNVTFARGLTYWLADGSYGSRILNTSASSTQTITIKKATASDHGTNTGWVSSDGDGQAAFDTLNIKSDYWVIDGTTRNESNWNAVSSYGFWANQVRSSTTDGGANGSNVTIRYTKIGPAYEENPSAGTIANYSESVYCLGTLSNWTIQRCHCHGSTHTNFQLVGVTGFVIEYNWIGPSWGKEAIRGGLSTTQNCIIRHNTFYNSTQIDPNDGTSGITAEIGIWSSSTGTMDNNEVYGNVFYNTKSGGRNACIVIGGDGSFWVGGSASNSKVYNNTFVGFPETAAAGLVDLNGGSGNEARNNLVYDCAGGGFNANTSSNNVTATINPFVGLPSNLNFHVTAGSQADGAGIDIGNSPYNTDRDGVSREGNWSVGAYEVA